MINLAKNIIDKGGSIKPLSVPHELSKGTGQANPSIFIDEGNIKINLRGVQYVLLHSENEQRFPSRWGPLAYLNPENDMHLRTTNFYMELDKDLNTTRINTVDTSKLDVPPVWEFIGLEDARLVKWDNKYYLCGVRRDTKPDGEGRMELSEIVITSGSVKEVARYRIEPPVPSYCEKNWMPVLDKPFHFVKWTNPTEVVKVDLSTLQSETVHLSDTIIPDTSDLRGGSAVISYKNNYVAIVHEVDLFKNELGQKDAFYYHRVVIWDKDWNIVRMTDKFNFMESRIEFCCGLGIIDDRALITFGEQDNASYLLSMSLNVWEELLWNN